MRKKQIAKAMKSRTPINRLYGLIPKDKKAEFQRFARCFGITPDDIKRILENEKCELGPNH